MELESLLQGRPMPSMGLLGTSGESVQGGKDSDGEGSRPGSAGVRFASETGLVDLSASKTIDRTDWYDGVTDLDLLTGHIDGAHDAIRSMNATLDLVLKAIEPMQRSGKLKLDEPLPVQDPRSTAVKTHVPPTPPAQEPSQAAVMMPPAVVATAPPLA